MDSKLLEYYNRELIYLREMGAEFAKRHPKVAGRLGMQGIDVTDPYVERLMEGFAFLTSRVQLKMDAEFPKFSQRLLEVLYPNYLSPTPSMAIAEFQPDGKKGELSEGYLVPRGTLMDCEELKRHGITCSYSTAHDVTLYPIKIAHAEITAPPSELPYSRIGLTLGDCQSALRIRLQGYDNVKLDQLTLDSLSCYLCGPEVNSSQLMELIMQHTIGVVYQIPHTTTWTLHTPQVLQHEGFEANQALLPNDLRVFDGYRLLHEYFAFPARFRFFSLQNIQPLFKQLVKQRNSANEFEIILLFDQEHQELSKIVDASQFAIHCTPIINLFAKTAERITLSDKTYEYHLVVDNIHPLDYEIFSVEKMQGSDSEKRYEQEFRPFYSTLSQDNVNHGAYFSSRREQRTISEQIKRHGSRTNYIGSEIFFSLVDEQNAPWHHELKYLSAKVLCTNRDIPLILLQQEQLTFTLFDSIPVQKVVLRHQPTPPRPALAEDKITWRLINQLQLNYLGLMEQGSEHGIHALQGLLKLYAVLGEPTAMKQIQGLLHCQLSPVYRRAPEPGPIVFSRGISIELTIDEQAFSGTSCYLLGCVLERLFDRLASINTFVETRLVSVQRGEVAHWQPRTGRKTLL